MEKSTKKIARSTFAIVFFALIGKILGLYREILIASKFGSGMEKDAFTLSQSATALISALITAAIATTFIPGIQKMEHDLGEGKKLIYTNNMLSSVVIISAGVTALGMIFSKQVAMLTAYLAPEDTFLLAAELTKVGMPVMIFSAIVGVLTGFLQYEGRFAAAGAVAIPLNLVYIIYLNFFVHSFGIVGLTVASVLGIVAQVIFLLPDAFRAGYRPKLIIDFKNKYVKEAVILSIPVLISTSINDLNVIVNRTIAGGLGEGAPSNLDYANKLNLMILGIFITAITAIIFPILSREFGSGNIMKGKRVMNAGVKTVFFITVPATVGLIILARPFVDIVYLHGRFTADDAYQVTTTLRCYTVALISISISNVLNRVYYSIHDTKTPFIVGGVNVFINIALNILVAHKFGIQGLATSVSIATTVAMFLSFRLLRKKIGNLGTKSYVRAFIKTIMASVLLGLICLLYFPLEPVFVRTLGSVIGARMAMLVLLLIIVAVAMAVYAVALHALGVREIRDLWKIAKLRFKKHK